MTAQNELKRKREDEPFYPLKLDNASIGSIGEYYRFFAGSSSLIRVRRQASSSAEASSSSAPLQVREDIRWVEEMGSASSPDGEVSSFLTIFFWANACL